MMRSAALPWLALLAVLPLHADDKVLEEVLVTATKRATTTREVPFSLNVQTGNAIRRAGIGNIEELSRHIAGLTVQNLDPGQSQVAIRGVSAGQIVRDQPGVKEQVGIYLDESVVSLSLFTPDFDLYDLNRVETLRGPQGTLFGSGSVGGTIRYITNQPKLDEMEGSLELDVNTVTDGETGGHAKGMVNLPLGGAAALRLVGYTNHYPGFIDARTDSGSDNNVNDGTHHGVRATLKIQPGDRFTITPRIVYQAIETDGFNRQEKFNLFANPFTTTRPAVRQGEREQFLRLNERFRDETLLADVTIEAGFGLFNLTSVTSYTEREIYVGRDASALTGSVSVDLGYPEAAVLNPSNLIDTTDVEQVTQGVRLGGVNDPLNTALCTPGDLATFGNFQSYGDETMWNYEVGVKADFDNGLSFQVAAFYADIKDLQVTLDAGSCSSRISFNVDEAHSTGLEFEFAVRPVDRLIVAFAGSLIESEFDSTVYADNGAILGR